MKKHPKWGVDILSQSGETEAPCHYPVLQHQERLDGWTYAEFEQALQRFVEAAEAWKDRLSPHEDQNAEQPTPLSPEISQHHLKA